MYRVRVKREKYGRCNLCRQQRPLSWDHVPPSGSAVVSRVELETIGQALAGSADTRQPVESQNGLKFRTVCADCNSFLGREFDPELNRFSAAVRALLLTVLTLPPVVSVRARPWRIIWGIAGHLLAAKAAFDEVIFDESVRDLIFTLNDPLPERWHVFYWTYPYPSTVAMRDFMMPSVRGDFDRGFSYFSLLKYHPIGYLVSDASKYEALSELTRWRLCNRDDEIDIPIQLRPFKPPSWPEVVDDGNFLVAGGALESAVIARPRQR